MEVVYMVANVSEASGRTSGSLETTLWRPCLQSEFASKVHGTLQRVGTSKTSTSTRADKIGESIRQFVIGMRKHTVDLFR